MNGRGKWGQAVKKCAIALAIAALAATGFGVAAPSSANASLTWLTRLVTQTHDARPRVLRLVTHATAETFTFSERVKVVHRSFAIECTTGEPRGFTLSASPSSRITLTLDERLRNGAICTVLARASWVHDLGTPSLSMKSTFRRTFTVGSPAPAPQPTTTTPTPTPTTAPSTTAPTTTTATTTTTSSPAAATHFVLSAATSTPTAGQTDNLTIVAKDAHGGTFAGYTGDKVLTFGGAASAPDGTVPTVTDATGSPMTFGTATTIAFADGIASVSGGGNGAMVLYKAGAASITVSDGSISGTSSSVTTAPGTSARLAFAAQPATSQAIQSTGTFAATAVIEDTNGNLVDTDSSSVALAIGDNPSSGVLSCAGGLSSAATNGVASFTGCAITKDGAAYTLTATDGVLAEPADANAFDIIGGPVASFVVEASGGGAIGTEAAGAPFDIGLTALDANGNTAAFTGTVDLASNRTCSAGCTTTAAFTNGVLANASVTLTQSGAGSTITATQTDSSETGTSNTFTVDAAAPDHFSVGTIAAQTAGTPFNVSITAKDAFDNVATGFSGTVDVTSDRTCSAGCTTTVALTAGVLANTSVTLTQAGASSTITATQTGSSETGTSGTFTVDAAVLDHFSAGPIAVQTAGTPFNVSITAEDAFNNVETGFSGTVDLTSNRTCSAGCTTTAAFTNGVLASTSVTLTQTGTLSTITATQTGSSETGTSNTFTVNAAVVTHFTVAAIGGGAIGTQTAGTPFNVSIAAKDASNNTVTGFTGTVDVTSNRTCTSGCATSVPFTNGVLASTSVTLTQTGTFSTITATQTGSSEAGTSGTFTVIAGAATHFSVGSIAAQTAGAPFNVSVTAKDAFDNVATGFSGTVDLTSNRTCSAGCTTTAAFTNGVLASASVTLRQTGSATITATQTGSSETGTSGTFTVGAAVLDHFSIGPVAAQTAGAAFNIGITAQDAYDNTATTFTGTVDLTSNRTCSAGCTTTAAFTNGVLASASVTLTQTGSATITATQTGSSETGTSSAFAVNAAAVTHFVVAAIGGGNIGTQTAGTPFNVSITAEDASNNTATGFSGTVDLTSNRACSAGCTTTVTFTAGVLASTSVTLTQSGGGSRITATHTGAGETGTSNAFNVIAGAPTHFSIGPIAAQTAGAPFNVSITAQDAFNNTATGFSGTVDVTSNRTCSAGCTTTATFTTGVLAVWSMTLTEAGTSSTITAVHTGGVEFGTSNTFTVGP
jgi:hypothetical protein